MRCLLLWIVLALLPYTGMRAQTDSLPEVAPDSVLVAPMPTRETHNPKTKNWPIAATVMAILVTSYLLYNVRSR